MVWDQVQSNTDQVKIGSRSRGADVMLFDAARESALCWPQPADMLQFDALLSERCGVREGEKTRSCRGHRLAACCFRRSFVAH